MTKEITWVIGLLVLIAVCSTEPIFDKSEMNGDGKTVEDVNEVIATEKTFPIVVGIINIRLTQACWNISFESAE